MFNKQIAIDLWRQGLSQSAIAAHFGMTKGQISGRFGRDRASFPKRSETMERVERDIGDSLHNPPERKSSNALRKLFHVSKTIPKQVSKSDAQEYDNSRLPGYSLFENTGCKWPLTDNSPHMFCGAQRMKLKSWCEAHNSRAWRAQ